jgi:hypothetical protein
MDGGGGRQNTPLRLVATSRTVQETQKRPKSNARKANTNSSSSSSSTNNNQKGVKTRRSWRRRRAAGGGEAEPEGASMVRVAARALDDAIVQMSKVSDRYIDVMRST